MKLQKYYIPFLFFSFIAIFFLPLFSKGKVPIPTDTIIGLYHPFRDLYANNYPNGIPFKNFLITDPVRQQYPWKELVISMEKKLELPLWNPYSFSGTPHLANFQSAAFYPFNILYFLFSFKLAWSISIISQLIFAGAFLYLYLKHMNIHPLSSLLGALTFSFSGFSIVWLEWNTVLHVVLWLPLFLLVKEHLLKKISIKWVIVFIIAESSAIFAGHLQIYFYLFLISTTYLFARLFQLSDQYKKERLKWLVKKYRPFVILGIIIIVITSIQTFPTAQFISLSARDVDQLNSWQKDGWFIPPMHLIQFLIPDFFGNPTTLNYWGTWNYAELVGYVGITPLVFASFALFFRRDKKTLFFGTIFFLSLIFALPSLISEIPFKLHIPFIATAQPTRLLFITDFSLAVLAAFGFDYFIRSEKKKILYPLLIIALIVLTLWGFVLSGNNIIHMSTEHIFVAKRNLTFPSLILLITIICVSMLLIIKNKKYQKLLYVLLVFITMFDLLRFADKFTPFTDTAYLFPSTKTIEFLQKNTGNFRIMSTDSRILPPNFSVMYRLQSIEGYDPLYLQTYGELIAASERGRPDISAPFGFNRIITPHNFNSKIIDLLGVKYILSLSDLSSQKLVKVFQEGQTRVYENKNVYPRVFLTEGVFFTHDNKDTILAMFDSNLDLRKYSLIENPDFYYKDREKIIRKPVVSLIGKAEIVEYTENKIIVKTESNRDTLLVITDSYYPTWQAKVYPQKGYIDMRKIDLQQKIDLVDYNFRGVFVPRGKYIVEVTNHIF